MDKYKTSNDMKDKIKEICNKLNREQISVQGATEQLFDLYNVVGQSEQLPEYELEYCGNCMQMKNHINGICQKCK